MLENELFKSIRKQIPNWGRTWLTDFKAGKTLLVSFDQSNNTGAIDVKMDGPVLEANVSNGKTASRKLEP